MNPSVTASTKVASTKAASTKAASTKTPRTSRTAAQPSSPGRRRGTRIPRADYPVERLRLANGLRVLLAPDRGAGVVGVAVHYDVGFRSEPQGRTGFAHLFEHLMFQGSESLPKLEHFRLVQSSGGVFNGSTHTDYTDYFEVVPAGALERALFLEADRMRAPRITAENLTNQVDVVSEEIRLNVLNRPYGGFPWIQLPAILFDSFANAHNGYGDFIDLQSATVEDCAEFFETYYTPDNAVLTVCGDFDVAHATDLVTRHFDDVPYRPAPIRPSFDEPWPTSVREAEQIDQHAPSPALAVGWRLPDPVADLPGYLSFVVLASMLTDGESSRLQSAVIAKAALATDIWASPGLLGGPLDSRNPDVFVLGAIHSNEVPAAAVIDAATAEISVLAAEGPGEQEMQRALARFASALYRDNDGIASRTRSLGGLELLHGRAELLSELPDLLSAISPEQVADAASSLDPGLCAILRIVPAQAR